MVIYLAVDDMECNVLSELLRKEDIPFRREWRGHSDLLDQLHQAENGDFQDPYSADYSADPYEFEGEEEVPRSCGSLELTPETWRWVKDICQQAPMPSYWHTDRLAALRDLKEKLNGLELAVLVLEAELSSPEAVEALARDEAEYRARVDYIQRLLMV